MQESKIGTKIKVTIGDWTWKWLLLAPVTWHLTMLSGINPLRDNSKQNRRDWNVGQSIKFKICSTRSWAYLLNKRCWDGTNYMQACGAGGRGRILVNCWCRFTSMPALRCGETRRRMLAMRGGGGLQCGEAVAGIAKAERRFTSTNSRRRGTEAHGARFAGVGAGARACRLLKVPTSKCLVWGVGFASLDDPKTCASIDPWMDEPSREVRAQRGGYLAKARVYGITLPISPNELINQKRTQRAWAKFWPSPVLNARFALRNALGLHI